MVAPLPPDDKIAWKVWVGSIISVVLATAAVAARLVARKLSAAPFWWDDWFIVMALVVHWSMGIVRWIVLVDYNYGRHIQYVGKENVILFWKAFVGIQVTYFLNAALTKMSLLFLYQRIFGLIKSFRYSLFVAGFLVLGYWIATTILAFTACTPLARNWDKTVPGTCVNLIAFFRWNGICNLILDFLILCLPLPMVWRLQISVKQKLVLSSIFALGLFVCITSILRVMAYNPTQVKDGTYSTVGTVTWSSVEQGLGIVCACLPTLRPLFGFLYSPNSKSGNTNSNSIGMDTFSGKSPAATTMRKNSTWADDSGSTVGFARLQDEEGVLSPIEMQRSVYGSAPIAKEPNPLCPFKKAAMAAELKKAAMAAEADKKLAGMGIMKDTTIDQQSEIVR